MNNECLAEKSSCKFVTVDLDTWNDRMDGWTVGGVWRGGGGPVFCQGQPVIN